jgi:hypothetical protein
VNGAFVLLLKRSLSLLALHDTFPMFRSRLGWCILLHGSTVHTLVISLCDDIGISSLRFRARSDGSDAHVVSTAAIHSVAAQYFSLPLEDCWDTTPAAAPPLLRTLRACCNHLLQSLDPCRLIAVGVDVSLSTAVSASLPPHGVKSPAVLRVPAVGDADVSGVLVAFAQNVTVAGAESSISLHPCRSDGSAGQSAPLRRIAWRDTTSVAGAAGRLGDVRPLLVPSRDVLVSWTGSVSAELVAAAVSPMLDFGLWLVMSLLPRAAEDAIGAVLARAFDVCVAASCNVALPITIRESALLASTCVMQVVRAVQCVDVCIINAALSLFPDLCAAPTRCFGACGGRLTSPFVVSVIRSCRWRL